MIKRMLIAALLWPLVALGQSYPSPTYQNLTVLGTLNASFSFGNLPAQAANTVVANATASSHSPTAVSVPSCSTTNSALQYTSGTGFSCLTTSAVLGANTFTGVQTVNGSSSPQVIVNDTSGTGTPRFIWNNNGTNVWALVTQNGGSGTLALFRYVSGINTDQPITVSNSTGAVTMGDGITGSPISGSTGAFTTLSASSTVSGTGFSSYLAAPPAIGSTTPAAGSFTTLSASGAITPSQTAGIVGTTTNNNASAGSVGETVTSNVLRASAVSLTTNTPSNVTSISLTAGDWDVSGQVILTPNASTTITQVSAWISTTSASLPSDSDPTKPWFFQSGSFTTGNGVAMQVTRARLSLSATTTVFLSTQNTFGVSTMTGCGFIQARRVR